MTQCCFFRRGIREDPHQIYFILRTAWRAILNPEFASRKLAEATLEKHSFCVPSQIPTEGTKGGSFFRHLCLPLARESGVLAGGR